MRKYTSQSNTSGSRGNFSKGKPGYAKGNSGSRRIYDAEKHLPPDPAEIKEILGVVSDFRIAKITPIGAYLSPVPDISETDSLSKPDFEILLPKNELAGREFRRGDLVQAFVYLDSEDRPVSTLKPPVLSIGKLAVLKVREVSDMGAFLDWGLLKDLFLPFKEQTIRVKTGQDVLVTLYIDKSSRLCASMKIYKLLKADSPYKENDHVKGLVYELSNEFGAYVAVDNEYSAMIPARDMVKSLRIGDVAEFRVSKVQPDGKLELAMRERGYVQLDKDCEKVYEELKASKKGFLPYHDKSESLVIKNKFNMSKIAFKRAIGHLYKKGMIVIKDDGIYLPD